ncbi:MAG: hypothetical protein AAF850_02295 [Pseudomonadota bacterium]
MSDATKEMVWMGGCVTIMIAFGVVALVGYFRIKKAEPTPKSD